MRELEAIRAFLGREDRCVVICPHHDIGAVDDLELQRVEFNHHRDVTIPAARAARGVRPLAVGRARGPVVNQFGLNPARLPDGTPAPLVMNRDLPGVAELLAGVTTFNIHPHLPHLYVPPEAGNLVDVLARQLINPTANPHPFTNAGNRHFNALLEGPAPGLAGAGPRVRCDPLECGVRRAVEPRRVLAEPRPGASLNSSPRRSPSPGPAAGPVRRTDRTPGRIPDVERVVGPGGQACRGSPRGPPAPGVE